MRFCVINFSIDPAAGLQHEPELDSLFSSGHVVNYHAQLVEHGHHPYWTVLVAFKSSHATRSSSTPKSPKKARQRIDPRQEMSTADVTLYEQLRNWRNDTAIKEGKPPYIIFSNAQLAELVSRRPQSISAMREVDGIGAGLCEAYGAAVLALLHPKSETPS